MEAKPFALSVTKEFITRVIGDVKEPVVFAVGEHTSMKYVHESALEAPEAGTIDWVEVANHEATTGAERIDIRCLVVVPNLGRLLPAVGVLGDLDEFVPPLRNDPSKNQHVWGK